MMLLAVILREVLTEFRPDRAGVCPFVGLGAQFKLPVSEMPSWI